MNVVQAGASKKGRAYWVGLAGVFLLALSVRLSSPASKYTVWYERSAAFWGALMDGDLAATYQSYHPGVTTMWIAGVGMESYLAFHGRSPADIVSLPSEQPSPQSPAARAGTAALSLVISLSIVGICVLLSRMTDATTALIAGGLLALDPFYVAQSKMIHVDALLSSFMVLSALFLIRHLDGERWRDLVLSGVFCGLALLTKSPALFLVPYAVLIVALQSKAKGSQTSSLSSHAGRTRIGRAAQALVVWGLVGAGVFFILWPAMWVQPLKTASDLLLRGALHHAEQSHPFPQFFMGKMVRDPGPLYYAAILAWKTTLVTLPAAAVGLWAAVSKWSRKGARTAPYLLIFAAGFLLQMTVSAKKTPRYILPVFLVLDVAAGWAIVRVIEWVRERAGWLTSRGTAALVVGALLLQGALVLRVHPYPGTHHNLLLGGSRVARQILQLGDQGEGLDRAAAYLNEKPGAGFLTVGICDHGNLMFRENFEGVTKPINHTDVDYRVFYVNDLQRSVRFEHCQAYWEGCQEAELVWTQSFDGVPYVWICSAYPRDLSAFTVDGQIGVGVGAHIDLMAYRLSTAQLSAGDTLSVTLFWQSDGLISADNHVFVHVLDESGELVAQHDGVPASGKRPTWGWQEEEVISDEHVIRFPEGLTAGRYTLSAGMYDYGTKARLQATRPNGTAVTAGRIPLAEIELRAQ